ncbi:vacuolar membrane ATPase 10 [Prunus dulcis]|uniref:Vacuolar membrane ATPase 10 n=1 Tax=Prunus dulcis TaxID=3755 RepID=A0A4Y1R3V2_PRUDU|nr:vacuolar membrane ATPase 10 [Prunus dulcis]
MASNRGQGGIQQLLTAEQEAQHIVNAARSAKMARLKQAKDEAEREIAETRSQVELQFQKKVAALSLDFCCGYNCVNSGILPPCFHMATKQSSGDSGANVKRLEHETEHKINHLSSEASRISSDVVQMLLKQVTTVKV